MSEYYYEIERKNIDEDNEYGKSEEGSNIEAEIHSPFNPKYVDIITQTMVISNIVEQLKHDEIDMNPDFQRYDNLWNDQKRSRLIESLIIKIPLPTFYFDYNDDEEKLIVVDGLQRLTTIKRFMALPSDHPDKLRLTGMEYLKDYDGLIFEELPGNIQRRIREQSIIAYMIRPGTPEPVRNSIFTRINTGGVQLTPAEIKNSVYRGKAADLLKELAHSEEFRNATNNGVPSERMLDCEFVNRFMAFYILGLDSYNDNLEEYYNEVLLRIKNSDDKEYSEWKINFLDSMKLCNDIFGKNAFRRIGRNGRYSKINKPLFECVSVTFSNLNSKTRFALIDKKPDFLVRYNDLLKRDTFIDAITSGTAKKNSIVFRNKCFSKIIMEAVGYDKIFSY